MVEIENKPYILGIFHDVSKLVEEQQKLKENEQRYKAITSATSTIIWQTAPDGSVTEYQERWAQFTGQTFEEMKNFGWTKAFHPDDLNHSLAAWEKAVKNKSLFSIQQRLKRHDGQYRFFEVKATPVLDEQDEIKEWIGTHTDITERKEAERKMLQEKEFSDSVINAMPGIFYLFNDKGAYVKWNKMLEELSGFTSEEIAERSPLDYFADYHKEKVAGSIQNAFKEGEASVEADLMVKGETPTPFFLTGRAIELNGKPHLLGVGMDISKRIKAENEKENAIRDLNERVKEMTCLFEINEAIKDPEVNIPEVMEKITHSLPKGWHYPEKTAVEIKLDDVLFQSKLFKESQHYIMKDILINNKKRGYVKVNLFDMESLQSKNLFPREKHELLRTIANNTGIYIHRVEANKKLLETMENLNQSNKELERFAYIASHDLQEPLRMVSSFTQLLERRYKNQLDERADKYIHYAVNGANRMQNLINDLLDFSRISTRGDKFKKTDTNLVVENVLANLSVRIEETGAQIKTSDLPLIMADTGQVERLFLNLVANALKFTKPGEKPIIQIDAEEQKENWLFRIKDNGIGIDEKYKEKVFIIFQRLHGASEYKGTGIGLAICKRIVQRHQGEIWFESEENKGTTFFFTLKKHKLKDITTE
ncbi:MAG: PAS domain S-box protein [Prolixibacteraceae bacterium]|nr:PAS domain S-box protein [Prolixibacteraceae bacterium]